MGIQSALRCQCGKLQGIASDVSGKTGNRVICYCRDCQAFARFLGRDDVVDELGGSEIYQMASWRFRLTSGTEHLRCIRLSPKGLHRWYADCCRTPIGNTVGPGAPFIGVVQPFMHDYEGRSREEAIGKIVARVYGKDAIGGLPTNAHAKAPASFLLRAAPRLLRWLLGSRGKPHPMFDPKTKAPRAEPKVLTKDERNALR